MEGERNGRKRLREGGDVRGERAEQTVSRTVTQERDGNMERESICPNCLFFGFVAARVVKIQTEYNDKNTKPMTDCLNYNYDLQSAVVAYSVSSYFAIFIDVSSKMAVGTGETILCNHCHFEFLQLT